MKGVSLIQTFSRTRCISLTRCHLYTKVPWTTFVHGSKTNGSIRFDASWYCNWVFYITTQTLNTTCCLCARCCLMIYPFPIFQFPNLRSTHEKHRWGRPRSTIQGVNVYGWLKINFFGSLGSKIDGCFYLSWIPCKKCFKIRRKYYKDKHKWEQDDNGHHHFTLIVRLKKKTTRRW